MHRIELSFTAGLVRKATVAYLRRGLGFGGLLGAVALASGAILLLVVRPGSWLSGLAAGATAVIGVLIYGLYVVHYRRGLAKLERMGSPVASLELDDAGLKVVSGAGSFSAPWSAFSDLWQFPEFWLLIIGPGQFLTLPISGFSPEARAFLAARVPSKQSAA